MPTTAGGDLFAVLDGSRPVIVFDVEGTCWRGVWHRRKETIEIGAVRYLRGTDRRPEFQTFVRPVQIPKLSRFCQELTGIRQADVDGAPTFQEAFHAFLRWATHQGDAPLLASWGPYDLWQLDLDLELLELPKLNVPLLDVRALYLRLSDGSDRRFAAAAKHLGIEEMGRRHRAIDDARVTAEILDRLLHAADEATGSSP